MKNQIITLLLILVFQNSHSQTIPTEWAQLFYNLPLNTTMEEIIAKAKTIDKTRFIDDANGYSAYLDSTDLSLVKPDASILNINSGIARFDNQKLSTNQTIIISIHYFYSAKNNAISSLEALKKMLEKNTVSYNTTSEETEIKGVFGYSCLLKNSGPLPNLIIDIEKEDGKYTVVAQITRSK